MECKVSERDNDNVNTIRYNVNFQFLSLLFYGTKKRRNHYIYDKIHIGSFVEFSVVALVSIHQPLICFNTEVWHSYFTYYTFYDYLFYYQNALQTPTLNAEFTRRLYSVHAARSQRAHGALEDHTALPQRCNSVLSHTLWKRQVAAFVLSMLKVNAAAWRFCDCTAFPQRLHSVAGVSTERNSAFCIF